MAAAWLLGWGHDPSADSSRPPRTTSPPAAAAEGRGSCGGLAAGGTPTCEERVRSPRIPGWSPDPAQRQKLRCRSMLSIRPDYASVYYDRAALQLDAVQGGSTLGGAAKIPVVREADLLLRRQAAAGGGAADAAERTTMDDGGGGEWPASCTGPAYHRSAAAPEDDAADLLEGTWLTSVPAAANPPPPQQQEQRSNSSLPLEAATGRGRKKGAGSASQSCCHLPALLPAPRDGGISSTTGSGFRRKKPPLGFSSSSPQAAPALARGLERRLRTQLFASITAGQQQELDDPTSEGGGPPGGGGNGSSGGLGLLDSFLLGRSSSPLPAEGGAAGRRKGGAAGQPQCNYAGHGASLKSGGGLRLSAEAEGPEEQLAAEKAEEEEAAAAARWDPTGDFELGMGSAKLHLRARMHTLALRQVPGSEQAELRHLHNKQVRRRRRATSSTRHLLLPPVSKRGGNGGMRSSGSSHADAAFS